VHSGQAGVKLVFVAVLQRVGLGYPWLVLGLVRLLVLVPVPVPVLVLV
jgi:hypothetical protein